MGVSLPLDTGNHFLSIQICLLWTYKWIHTICGLLCLASFTYFSMFIHILACSSILFIFITKKYSIVWICHILFIHLSVDGHLGCFYHLAIMNDAIKIHVQVFMWTYTFIFLEYIYTQEKIAGSYANSIVNILKNSQTVFLSDCTVWHPTSNIWVPFSPTLTILLTFISFITVNLVDVKWYLIVVLIFILLMDNYIQHLFICLLSTLLLLLRNVYSDSLHLSLSVWWSSFLCLDWPWPAQCGVYSILFLLIVGPCPGKEFFVQFEFIKTRLQGLRTLPSTISI